MLTVIVLTHNSAGDVKELLPQVVGWAEEVLVVDDGSTDQTREIVEKAGARVITHELANDYSRQRNFGLDQAKNEWVLFVDADERVSEELKKEIVTAIKAGENDGFLIPRHDIFWGSRLRYGETGFTALVRLGKRSAGRWRRPVHEGWEINRVGKLHSPLIHFSHPQLSLFLDDINRYTTIEADYRLKKGEQTTMAAILIYPMGKFVFNYVVRLGGWDGFPGLVMATMMSLHSLMMRAKWFEKQRIMSKEQ